MAATSAPSSGLLPAGFQEAAYVELAHKLADAAGEVTRKYFRWGALLGRMPCGGAHQAGRHAATRP